MNPVPQPPEAPDIPRKTVVPAKRIAGLLLIAVLPICAGIGWLENHEATVETRQGDLAVSVEYPDRLRYQAEEPMTVTVRNDAATPIKKARVRIDRDYLISFIDVTYAPDPSTITDRSVEFDLGPIPGGESRRIQIYLTAEKYGSCPGGIQVESDSDRSEQRIQTLVLP